MARTCFHLPVNYGYILETKSKFYIINTDATNNTLKHTEDIGCDFGLILKNVKTKTLVFTFMLVLYGYCVLNVILFKMGKRKNPKNKNLSARRKNRRLAQLRRLKNR